MASKQYGTTKVIKDCPAIIGANEGEVCEQTIFPQSEIWEFEEDDTHRLRFIEVRADPGNRNLYENYEGNGQLVRNIWYTKYYSTV